MNKFNNRENQWWGCLRALCILMALVLCLTQTELHASSSTCNSSSSSGCTLREWLIKLQEESYSLECTLSQLEKSTTLLSKVNYSTTSMRLNQITKLKKTISNLKGEIEIINLTCSTFYGPDCNLTTPECNSKCLTCASQGLCSNCTGNWDGPTCSVCKQGWNGIYCNTPICDSKCLNCTSPGICSNCTGNWNGSTCSVCKSGWNGADCNTPICDSKCTSCSAPGICVTCSGNWNGTTCSVCKKGWNGTLCNIPICDSKCLNCTSPGICSNCTGNWNGTTCSDCKSGWTGTNCNSLICGANCASCSSPNVCSVCKSGWNGTDCNIPICGSNCTSCSAPNTCPTCKTGWYGSDCNSVFPLILTSAQITKFTSLIMSNAQITSTKLLFKASRDGFSVSTFHSKCDNKGPTIVIIKATSGAIFGGYTSANWTSQSTWAVDNSAFIFSLVSSTYVERFTKLTYQKKTNNSLAIYGYPSFGPTFGAGHDIVIADNSNSSTSSASQLCVTYCDTIMTWNTNESQSYLAGSLNFQVEDYEVYSL